MNSSSFVSAGRRRMARRQGAMAKGARWSCSRTAVALAVQAACFVSPVIAADTVWTGGAGPAQPYWDLGANWSAGAPTLPAGKTGLGAYNTELRSGSYDVGVLSGTGTLALTGGLLRLHGEGSTLGHLDFRGGELRGAGSLTVQTLNWSGGAFEDQDQASGNRSPSLTVQRAAKLSGSLWFGNGNQIQLNGRTDWLDGKSSFNGYGDVRVGASGEFVDHADTAQHDFGITGGFVNDGKYVKTGRGHTSFDGVGGASFLNNGQFLLQQGSVGFSLSPADGSWRNAGVVDIGSGTRMSVYLERFNSASNSGTVRVRDGGEFALDTWISSNLQSTGEWIVDQGGRLNFKGEWGEDPWGGAYHFDSFAGRGIQNDGVVVFSGNGARFAAGTTITGSGRVEVLDGGYLRLEGDQSFGALRVDLWREWEGGPNEHSSVSVGGKLVLASLDWAQGLLHAGGGVTVNGDARLSGGAVREVEGPDGAINYEYDKRLTSNFTFGGRTTWEGGADITGPGSIRVASTGVFRDQAAVRANSVQRIALDGGFHNDGTYLKTSAGRTMMDSAFVNKGTVRVENGTLTFVKALDNQGTLAAVNGRIVVHGPLAQIKHSPGHPAPNQTELTGGTLEADRGTIVLHFDPSVSGNAQWRPGIHVNSGSLVLKGANARIATVWLGEEVDALQTLEHNKGQLSVLEGAQLKVDASLDNDGRIEVGLGSVLEVTYGYTQGNSGQTWVAGEMHARDFWFSGGLLGAGLEGAIGTAELFGSRLSLSDGARLDVDIGGLDRFDRFLLDGELALNGGVLVAEFGAGDAAAGTYRLVDAAGGVTGTFGELVTNLDQSRYGWSLVYGDTYVDLSIVEIAAAPVPEPETYALMGLGLAGVVAWSRRRAARQALPQGGKA
ncbi:PEP-CTERM sorting domain-containing protein [Caldimonas brevitalea]|uniref:Ice-binding protein C-terminal domain-containing protein n=1 Tax=Caldimonas brevitalea TaxID=413882 RepID=A0A0G3BJ91_9BURK|nr:PEP-CTERM sorting domain-containing protein [Caldimonas brevitalea]AKJ27436.1 hypothetical protein AAW51_0745 [Caldimonas brevitalea]